MVDGSQDILQEVQRLGGRFGRMEVRLESMDARLGAIDTRLGTVETRLSSMETNLGSVETRLGSMDSRLVLTNARLGSLESRSTAVEEAAAGLAVEIKSWPDVHYLAAAAKAQLVYSRDIKTDVANLEVRMDEIYRSMATSSEIQGLRDEVSKFRDQSIDIDVRIGTVEGRLGIESRTRPRRPAWSRDPSVLEIVGRGLIHRPRP
jgi:chromosome segregation ATPase